VGVFRAGSIALCLVLPALYAQPSQFTKGCNGASMSNGLRFSASGNGGGSVTVTITDPREPALEFLINWGDGTATRGFSPQTHIYSNTNVNYGIRIEAFENDGTNDCVEGVAAFTACTYTLTPPLKGHSNTQETGTSFSLGGASQSCSWQTFTTDPWISITSGVSGTGASGTVQYSIQANPGPLRVGTIHTGGAIYTVIQQGGCTPVLSPETINLPSAASTRTATVTLTSGCAWTATGTQPWITITSGTGGSGNGTIGFSVSANTGLTSRSGAIRVNGQEIVIRQAGTNCTFNIVPGGRLAASAGESGFFRLLTQAGCSWTTTSNVPWITATPPAVQSGSGDVQYTVQANPTSERRVGSITAGGHTFTVSQLGQGPSFSCSVNTGVPPIIRAGGIAERVGDVVVFCTGTAQLPQDTTADFNLAFNTAVTSRIVDPLTARTEALLLANEAGESTVPPSLGVNAFTGRIVGPHVLRWANVPIGRFVNNGQFVLRFTNLRVNTFGVPAAGAVTIARAHLDVRTYAPLTLNAAQARLDVAFVQPPLNTSTGTPGSAGPANTWFVPVSFTERFINVFKIRVAAGQDKSSAGQEYNSESGYKHTAIGAVIGSASNGTRLGLRVGEIPAGVIVRAALQTAPSTLASFVSGADLNGAGGTLQPPTSAFTALTVNGGIARAVWEIVQADPLQTETIGVLLRIENATAEQVLAIRGSLIAGLAPLSSEMLARATAPIPRFIDPGNPPGRVDVRVRAAGVTGVPAASSQAKSVRREVVGSNRRFSYEITNDSSDSGTGAIVRGNAPIGFSYTECSRSDGGPCDASGSEMTADLGTLDPGETLTVDIDATQVLPIPNGGYVENSVSVSTNELDTEVESNTAASGFVEEACAGPLTPSSAAFPSVGGQGAFAFPCASLWSAQSTAEWITILTGSSGNGAGNVTYAVAPHGEIAGRTGTIIAGGMVFTVTQAALCTYQLTSSGSTIPPGGGNGSFGLNTQANCPWTATSNQTWASVTTPSGAGGGQVSFSVLPNNTGVQRTATISVGGRTHIITQTALPPSCVTSLTPGSDTVAAQGNSAALSIVTPAGCAWTAVSSASWLEVFPTSGAGSASIRWTAYPNFGTRPRTATIIVGDKVFTVTESVFAETVMQRFVRLLYFSFLARAAADSEVALQVNSGLSRAQLASNFMNSEEFNLGGRFVAGLYVGILNRDAEFTGWQFQRNALATRVVSQDQLVSNFINSAEFNLKFGVLTNAAFIRLLYTNILLREAGQNEVDAWLNVMSNPANTRTIVARTFLNSSEFRQGTGPRLLAFLLYATLLLRDGAPAERAPIVAQLANPAQLQPLIAFFANSSELNSLLE
jgi:hypothetical protein